MRRKLLLLILGSVLFLTACSSTTSQAPVPTNPNRTINATLLYGSSIDDWPMFGYDPGHTGYVDASVLAHAVHGKLLWFQKLGPIFSSPVAGLGMLFIASTNSYLYALKQNTGAVVWRTQLKDYLTDATPVLVGQILFVAVHSSALAALDARTGRLYWTFETNEKIQAPPLVIGRHILLASRTTLWSLDAVNGQLAWKFHRGVSGWPTSGSPTVAGNTVYFGLGSETALWAVNLLDGHILWSFDVGDRITSTAVAQANTVYVATWHGMLFALNKMNGKKRWSYSLNPNLRQTVVDGVGGSMALAKGYLYVGDYRGSILCLDAIKGRLIWQYATAAQVLATPIIAAGLVYVGSSDGYFYALDIQTGRPAWRYLTGEVRSSASLANSHLYVGSLNGMMYAFT
ncbi:MAG: PQQ-binding-like beta-propeller repeat protein [Ktedonobacteraceae bacterium]